MMRLEDLGTAIKNGPWPDHMMLLCVPVISVTYENNEGTNAMVMFKAQLEKDQTRPYLGSVIVDGHPQKVAEQIQGWGGWVCVDATIGEERTASDGSTFIPMYGTVSQIKALEWPGRFAK